MTRDKAIEICKKIRHYLTFENPIWDIDDIDKVHEALTIAIVNMEVIPKLEARLLKEGTTKGTTKGTTFGKWIPCSERLPEEDHFLGGSGKQFSEKVLVTVVNHDDDDIWVDATHTVDGKWMLELPRHCRIIAWMELPEPYTEEQP